MLNFKKLPNVISKIESFVYLCKNFNNGSIKIGYTSNKNPTIREKTLQSEEPYVDFIRVYKGTRSDEQILHDMFNSKRIRGEWFNLGSDEISKIDDFFNVKYVVVNRKQFIEGGVT